ncbi:hypothetical protein DPMN_060069 [Dreissena polymorpha]|uniref:Uncharacterized protein n=1 Tax=Dreissena polymorpha TaxID=45954 RepID=A0A9D4C541_DREPO|nr:hypothetical protein DPMN_060069 [Dreissena polymorpha]
MNRNLAQATILVISPLTIIQNEQIETLKKYDVKACRLSYHECDGEVELMEKDMIQNIAEGEFAVVFAHPEALLNSQWKSLAEQKTIH